MNEKKTSILSGFGIYIILIAALVGLWFWMTGNTSSSSYTKAQLVEDIEDESILSITITQNREVPTGSLRVAFKNGVKQTLYTSDVNEMQTLLDELGFTSYTCKNVPEENWLLELLPYLLMFGAFFILFIIMNNNAASQNGNSKMMNFGRSRAKLSTEEDNHVNFNNVAGLREEKE